MDNSRIKHRPRRYGRMQSPYRPTDGSN